MKDYVSRDLFEELMKDEEGHIDFLETQLDLVSKLGVELYSQHHIGEMHEGDEHYCISSVIPRTREGEPDLRSHQQYLH